MFSLLGVVQSEYKSLRAIWCVKRYKSLRAIVLMIKQV